MPRGIPSKKGITKSKIDPPFKDALPVFKEDSNTLKEHIYLKRKQFVAYREIKAD